MKNKKIIEEVEQQEPPQDIVETSIIGDTIVYPYEVKEYSIPIDGGKWGLSNNKAKIIGRDDQPVVSIEITTGRSGTVDLNYVMPNGEIEVLPIEIKSL